MISYVNQFYKYYHGVRTFVGDFMYHHIGPQILNWNYSDILSSPIWVAYKFNGKHYDTPFYLASPQDKQQYATVLSVMIESFNSQDENITQEFLEIAGPYENFYMQPVVVGDAIPYVREDFKALHVMVIVDGQILTYSYTDYDQILDYQYYIYWSKYLPEERKVCLKRLEYLDLN
jgi:hypothetical protein